jgi:hypothetical protein
MRHYDVEKQTVITHEEALSRLPGVVTNPTAGMFESAGVPELIEWPGAPVGNVEISGSERVETGDGYAFVTYDCEPIAARDARAADDEVKRLLGLVDQHRAAIAELAGLLSVFGLPCPVPESVAEKAVYEQTKTDHGKAADGVMLMRRYGQLVESLGVDLLPVITLVKGGA